MKRIMIAMVVMSFFLAFMPTSRALAGESATMKLLVDSATELTKIIKDSSNSNSKSESDLILEKKLETYQINKKYTVKVSDGYFKKKPCILFTAFDKDKLVRNVYYEKNLSEDMQEIDNFNKMNLADKKIFIKNSFLKYTKIDLGEVETEPTVSAPAPVKSETETSATQIDKSMVKSFR